MAAPNTIKSKSTRAAASPERVLPQFGQEFAVLLTKWPHSEHGFIIPGGLS